MKLPSKKELLIVLAIAFFAASPFVVSYIMNRPRDIGPRLEFIAEKNHGCSWIMGVLTLGFCGDKEANHSYYFATDMSESEVESYFKGVTLVNAVPGYNNGRQESSYITFSRNGQAASVELFFNVDATGVQLNTNKAHVLDIDAASYKILRQSY